MAKIMAMVALLAVAGGVAAQTGKSATQSIEEYRAMLADGNPSELFEAKGEALWSEKRGPKKAALDKCDLGKGPGVVKGAFVELPRWFADTGRVQDLESRLVTCMETLQGFDAKELAATPFDRGEQKNITALATWVASESTGMKFNLPQSHPQEQAAYEVGKRLFFMRSGPHDFSCATCHGQDGKRIRLQDLANLTSAKGATAAFGSWPAYRVSTGQMWGMEQRVTDCMRQQRFPYPRFGSEAIVSLMTYMGVNARGGESVAPGIKR